MRCAKCGVTGVVRPITTGQGRSFGSDLPDGWRSVETPPPRYGKDGAYTVIDVIITEPWCGDCRRKHTSALCSGCGATARIPVESDLPPKWCWKTAPVQSSITSDGTRVVSEPKEPRCPSCADEGPIAS